MDNKPIIIDEVDVSGCEFYNTDDETCREVNGKYDTDICEFDKCENSNCYFKQLARKTQECEELKSVRDSWLSKCEQETKIKEFYQDELNQLKATKEQAEQKLERIREIANNYDNCDDVGHYVQDTEARHALEEVAQAMCDISQIIDEE